MSLEPTVQKPIPSSEFTKYDDWLSALSSPGLDRTSLPFTHQRHGPEIFEQREWHENGTLPSGHVQ